jgi:hypothetical protein
LNCDYLLDGLDERTCPECGRPFDPQDVKTVREPGPAGTRRAAARRAGGVVQSNLGMTVGLLLSTWAAVLLGGLGVLIVFVAIVMFMWAVARRRWLAIGLALLLSPMCVSVFVAASRYTGGTAVIEGMGLPGTEYGNVDPTLRCGRVTGGCLVSGTEWITEVPNNATVALLTRVFGPQRGAYTGPYPTDVQASAAVAAGGEPVPAAAVRADAIVLKTGTVNLAPGVGKRLLGNTYLSQWYDGTMPAPWAAQTLLDIGPITGVLWQGCLVLRIPAGERNPANGEPQAACIVVVDPAAGYPFAYYAEGDYYHRYPPVEWRK